MLNIRDYIKQELKSIYTQGELTFIIQLILEKKLKISIVESLTYKLSHLSDEQLTILSEIVERLKHKEPIQYILGECEFFNLQLMVNSHTLIPRPETEELVELIINNEKNYNITILDIGTGSGCIAISLAHNLPQAKVYAWDVSYKAIEVAQKNAKQNNTDVTFSVKDILQQHSSETLFDVIVSNPPYITETEKSLMHNNVLDHEPHLALFVPNHKPLMFYEHIATFALNSLNSGGRLYLEINQYFGKETVSMLAEKGFSNIELHKDLAGNDRMIRAEKL